MKKILLAIGFTVGGIWPSLTQAQVIPLTIDSTQSTVSISVAGASSSSQMSGDAMLDLQFFDPPSGNVQITDLNLVADEALNFNLFLFVSASSSPGDVTVSMVTPGDPGTVAGTSFNQLENLITLGGDFDISDPLGLAGGNQTADLSEIVISPVDFDSITVTQSGDVITVSNSLDIAETLDLGGASVPVAVAVTYVATGVVPVSVLLGDVNMDGVVDFLDIGPFISIVSTGGFQAEADINQSGSVSFLDITPFIARLSGR